MNENQSSKEIKEIVEKIDQLNLGKVSELVNVIKEKYDIKEDVVIQPTGPVQASEKTAEKGGNVSVKLVKIEDKGLSSIKVYGLIKDAIKELKGEEINIIQAKKLTEKEDKIILENIPRDKAEKFKEEIEKGAEVEIK